MIGIITIFCLPLFGYMIFRLGLWVARTND